jgi:hypothetical protein
MQDEQLNYSQHAVQAQCSPETPQHPEPAGEQTPETHDALGCWVAPVAVERVHLLPLVSKHDLALEVAPQEAVDLKPWRVRAH